jgi:hypothetical protein
MGGAAGQPALFGAGPVGPPPGAPVQGAPGATAQAPIGPGQAPPGASPLASATGGPPAFGGGRGRLGGPFGDARSISAVLSYVSRHGGGTIAVSSQSSAAAAIIEKHANVAGIGGFSGRESEVSASWLAQEARAGRIRWVLVESTAGRQGVRGDTRVGAKPAMSAVASACTRVTLTSAAASSSVPAPSSGTLYDCRGRAAALAGAGRSTS